MESYNGDLGFVDEDVKENSWGSEHYNEISLMFGCQLMDGTCHSFNYSYLKKASFDPTIDDNVITVIFAEYKIEIAGFLLKDIYHKICKRKVISVIETGERYQDIIADNTPQIIKIEVSELVV